MNKCRCITFQTIEAAKASGRLEDLCLWYASEVARLQGTPTAPAGNPDVAAELAELRRNLCRANEVIAERNTEIESLRKKAPR